MTDKELIKQEIERLSDEYPMSRGLLKHLDKFIDSLPEKSASEDLYEEISKWRNHYISVLDNNLRIDLRDIEVTANYFAEWQKQQMMKDAVEGQIYREYIGDDGISIAFGLEAYLNEHNPKHNKLHDGDKVKIVIVKEEQQ